MAHCNDCGVDVHEIKEYSYRLKEKVWQKTGLGRGFLCVGCAEQRLGRALKSKDFDMGLAINYWFLLQSDRLRDRLFGLDAQVFIRRLIVANTPELKDELKKSVQLARAADERRAGSICPIDLRRSRTYESSLMLKDHTMISRMYSIEVLEHPHKVPRIENSYKGFDQNFDDPNAAVAIVHCQGETDFWALDDLDHAVSELKRMYDDDGETIDQLFLFQRVDT